ncbi:hypothetical protein D3C81_2013480 [compost metagenome]
MACLDVRRRIGPDVPLLAVIITEPELVALQPQIEGGSFPVGVPFADDGLEGVQILGFDPGGDCHFIADFIQKPGVGHLGLVCPVK